ncbi:MAG TPA: YCF48-related protein [Pyrinomonadaceae bacterium]|nr:YCF48-related protein [Pyrinomonadaceae bacterium]
MLNSVYFPTASVGWAVGSEGKIFFTSDKGDKWNEQKSGTTTFLNGIDCLSETECWAVGRGGLILHTTDQGGKWVHVNSKISADLMAVDFATPSVGWVVGKGVIFKTEDGGKTWVAHHITSGGETLIPLGY